MCIIPSSAYQTPTVHSFNKPNLHALGMLRLQPSNLEGREGQPTQEAGGDSSRLEDWKLPRLWQATLDGGGWMNIGQETAKWVYYRIVIPCFLFHITEH
jgi:hypothetical protein